MKWLRSTLWTGGKSTIGIDSAGQQIPYLTATRFPPSKPAGLQKAYTAFLPAMSEGIFHSFPCGGDGRSLIPAALFSRLACCRLFHLFPVWLNHSPYFHCESSFCLSRKFFWISRLQPLYTLHKEKRLIPNGIRRFWSCYPDSNWGPHPYQKAKGCEVQLLQSPKCLMLCGFSVVYVKPTAVQIR